MRRKVDSLKPHNLASLGALRAQIPTTREKEENKEALEARKE